MNDMPPVFEIHACSHDLTIYELDWTASDVAKSYAFTYGWVRASEAKDLVEETKRLRARVEVLERVREAALPHLFEPSMESGTKLLKALQEANP